MKRLLNDKSERTPHYPETFRESARVAERTYFGEACNVAWYSGLL